VIVLVAALVIDVGLAISQRERAADLADQAARAEAQNLSTDTLRTSGGAEIEYDGCQRAFTYLQDARGSTGFGQASLDTGYFGDGDACELSGQAPGNSVTVAVQLTYTPFVFDLFSGKVTVTETGTATAATGNN